MRSRNDLPGSCVTSITRRSESSFVPPVTAERSPPASRMTGADSPVIADSSTEPTPSMISPSAGITSPASTTTTSPRWSSGAGHLDPAVPQACAMRRRRASPAARSPAPCRGPRRSPRRSSRRARSARARSRSRRRTRGRSCRRAKRSRKKITVVITLPSSTMNITGFCTGGRGSSFGNESRIAASTSSREKMLPTCAGHRTALPLVEGEVQLEDVHARLAEEARGSGRRCSRRSAVCTVASGRWRTAAIAPRLQLRRWPGEMSGSMPERRGRDGVDRDVADRQARVVRALELQDRRGRGLDVLGEVGVRRAEVGEGRRAGVVGGRRRRRARVEVLRRR